MNIALTTIDTRRALRFAQPRTADHLHSYIRLVLGFLIPRTPMCDGHTAPFEYVTHAFFEDAQPRDCLVWAGRGGGKTQLGAIVTLLDMLFKPGVQVRILGGSFEQSSRMYRYLRTILESDVFSDCVKGDITGRALELTNDSRVEVLSQSQRAVRGQRVHKLRCDEVELFDPEVWDAAQLITRSGACGDTFVNASIEALSTMHQPFGLMQHLLDQPPGIRRIFRWNTLDVLERCPSARDCETCPLWIDCRGSAKQAQGFLHIDDAIQQMQRVSRDTWRSEMLCERPSRSDCVYSMFDPTLHVRRFDAPNKRDACAIGEVQTQWIGGIDFGYRAPTVLLWAFIDEHDCLHIIDELVATEMTTQRIIELAELRDWPVLDWLGADPAGHQRNEQTGVSTITLWRRAGWYVRTRFSTIEAGIELVRTRLQRADGTAGLVIHPRCAALIRSMQQYHYPDTRRAMSIGAWTDTSGRDDVAPVKDGPDHAADALRYMIVNLDERMSAVRVRMY